MGEIEIARDPVRRLPRTISQIRFALIALFVASVILVVTIPSRHSPSNSSIVPGLTTPSGYSPRQLIWMDTFHQTSLDQSRWNSYMTSIAARGRPWNAYRAGREVGSAIAPPSSFNAEADSPGLVHVGQGLSLDAHPGSPVPGYSYSGSVVDTYGKFGWRGGYFQALVKMPDVSTGYWPAIWFLPAAGAGTGGDIGEFDLQEGGYLGTGPVNDLLTSTLRSGGAQDQQQTNTEVDLSAGFHTYGAQYVPGRSMTVYFDGHEVARFTSHIPTWPLQLVIDLAVASNRAKHWHTTGSPPPGRMQISEIQFYS